MSQIDYEELIRSPLDDLDHKPASPWWTVVAGLAVGLLAGYVVTLWNGEATENGTAEQVALTPASTIAVETLAPDYPAGYTEYAPDLAARPEEIVVDESIVTVAFTSVVARGADPAAVSWPRGGSWLLETAAGVILRSNRVVFGGQSPGAFSVQFPSASLGSAEFDRVRLLDRWDTERLAGSTSMSFTGEPFAIEEPLSIPVSDQVTLLIPRLELGRFQGLIEWQLVGAEMGGNVNAVIRLLDDEDDEVGSYAAFPQIRQPGADGVIDVNWQRSFPIDQEGAVTLAVEYVVDVVHSTPVSVEFSLDDVPVGG